MSATPVPSSLTPLLGYLNSLSERAPLDELQKRLVDSAVTLADLREFLRYEDGHYCRNLVAEGAWYNMLAICWRSGQRSPIHDHAHSTCAFKVLTGVCSETVYTISPSGQVVPSHTTDMPAGHIVASQDADIHQVSNLQASGTDLVTLHIYSPPLKTMKVFSPMGNREGEWLAPEHKAVGA